jgi:hypothetical protein
MCRVWPARCRRGHLGDRLLNPLLRKPAKGTVDDVGIPGPGEPSPFLAGVGKGRFLGTRAAVLQRSDGQAWLDVARYRSAHDANAALDHAIGEGEEPGALRIVDAAPSTTVRSLMIVGAVVCVALAVAIVWVFVSGT